MKGRYRKAKIGDWVVFVSNKKGVAKGKLKGYDTTNTLKGYPIKLVNVGKEMILPTQIIRVDSERNFKEKEKRKGRLK